jgi:hypothetical protein
MQSIGDSEIVAREPVFADVQRLPDQGFGLGPQAERVVETADRIEEPCLDSGVVF